MPSTSHMLLPDLVVSRETEAKLRHLVSLVEKWNPHINLVSTGSLGEIWPRHVLDSAQLFHHLPLGARHWADLGSGGGFPGLVICILAQEFAPQLRMTLVESDQRKATFLRTVARELKLSAEILTTRIQETAPLEADVLSARALAPLTELLQYSRLHLANSGIGLFLKGRTVNQEIAVARQSWHFDLASLPSMTDPEAQILRIENIIHG